MLMIKNVWRTVKSMMARIFGFKKNIFNPMLKNEFYIMLCRLYNVDIKRIEPNSEFLRKNLSKLQRKS